MMKKNGVLFLFLLVAVWLVGGCTADAASETPETVKVLLLETSGPINSAMADYLGRGLDQAVEEGAEAVVFMLNTPGGAVSTMTDMVQRIRSSSVPVIVYVAPQGGMAGSAGTVITLAGHAAAMAPETAIGAASPVDLQGGDIPETALRKEIEMLRATVRTLAENRPAPAVQLAEETIEVARAVSASEALAIGLVDFIAVDVDDLLAQADGFEVMVRGESQALNTAEAQVEAVPETTIDLLLGFLTNPNIVFILLNVGVLAVLLEISNPGGWLAGFIGVICLALAVYGLGVLPVNWFGLVFIVLAFALFILELKTPVHGALTAAGIGAFIAGALILFNTVRAPEFQPVSIPLVVVSGIATGLLFAAILGFALRAQRIPVQTGQESFVGQTGIVREELNPRGQVQILGELWTAELLPGEATAQRGERVVVIEVDGLRLRVRRA
jgi:membrane-bound serine protease (ClpP class)